MPSKEPVPFYPLLPAGAIAKTPRSSPTKRRASGLRSTRDRRRRKPCAAKDAFILQVPPNELDRLRPTREAAARATSGCLNQSPTVRPTRWVSAMRDSHEIPVWQMVARTLVCVSIRRAGIAHGRESHQQEHQWTTCFTANVT